MRFAIKIQYCLELEVGLEVELKDTEDVITKRKITWNSLNETFVQDFLRDSELHAASVATTAIQLREIFAWLKIASFRAQESIFELSIPDEKHMEFEHFVKRNELKENLNEKFRKSDQSSLRCVSIKELEKDPGEPIPLLREGKHGSPELDHDALARVLLHPNVGNRPVVLVSIAGAFRKGKSFMLNFLLRFLRNRGYENPDWLGDEAIPVDDGFAWRGGSKRHTTGITAWSEPFIVKKNDDEIAVFLLDTQGNFDQTSGKEQCTKIFAISMLLSSVLVFNVQNQIQENDLDYLQFATEYGVAAKDEGNAMSPFQKLFFLVRDCDFPEFDYGLVGGEDYLSKEVLRIDPESSDQSLIDIRKHLRESFGTVNCYLMPSPGEKAQREKRYPNFRGCLEDIDIEFCKYVGHLADALLKPENLVEKHGMTAQSLMYFIINCCNIIKNGKLPKPVAMMQAHAESSALDSFLRSTDKYNENMKKLFEDSEGYIPEEEFEEKERANVEDVVQSFYDGLTFGSEPFKLTQKERLQSYLSNMKKKFVKKNKLAEYQNKRDLDAVVCLMVEIYEDELSKAVMEESHLLSDDKMLQLHEKLFKEAIDGFEAGISNCSQSEEAAEVLKDEIIDAYELNKMRLLLKKETLTSSLQQAVCDSVEIYQREMRKVPRNDPVHFARIKTREEVKALTNFEDKKPLDAPQEHIGCSRDCLKQLLAETTDWVAGKISTPGKCREAKAMLNLVKLKVRQTKQIFNVAKETLQIYWDEKELDEKLNNDQNEIVEAVDITETQLNQTQATANETRSFAAETEHVAEVVFEIVKKRNKRTESRIRSYLEVDMLEITLKYLGAMEMQLKGSYVKPDVLSELHEGLISELLKRDLPLPYDVTREVYAKHEEEIKVELADQYEVVKEWNERNKSMFLRIIKSIRGGSAILFAMAALISNPAETFCLIKRVYEERLRCSFAKAFFGATSQKFRDKLEALKNRGMRNKGTFSYFWPSQDPK